ncbi:MAG: hypothetical protein MRERC_12c029 [Mycoplasmataceae bacterium RC_NB112A]|nr:MAG: hypothetical protein MRERC_12c029 [Mycoplasmataceae bacterium RC_NB112A]
MFRENVEKLLKALNDHNLTNWSDWNETLWFIQFVRRTNDPLFTNEDFQWDEQKEK